MNRLKKIISLILVLTLFMNLMPMTLFAETLKVKDGLNISADLDGTINIEAMESTETTTEDGGGTGGEETLPNIYGVLEITANTQTINRDYSQMCMVQVKNNSSTPYKYYLVSDNKYDDLSMNFVKECSIDNPLIIYPDEVQEIELSVFAQNAELSEYKIPICAYIVDGEKSSLESRKTITIKCNDTKFDVSCNLNSTDAATLTKSYTLTNNGDKITDISIGTDAALKDYVIFDPIIENYEMDTYSQIDFTVRPDLTKMSKENLSVLEGKIIAISGNKTKEYEIKFDTEGKPITTTTMGELALLQEGNPYINLTIDENSIKANNKYDALNGKIESTINYNMLYGSSSDKTIKTSFDMNIEGGKVNESEPIIEILPSDNEKSLKVHIRSAITKEEYDKILESIEIDSAQKTNTIFNDVVVSESAVQVEYADLFAYRDPDTDSDYIMDTMIDIASDDAVGLLPSYLGAGYGIISSGMDLMELGDDWNEVNNNPNISDGDKFECATYVALQATISIASVILTLTGVGGLGAALMWGAVSYAAQIRYDAYMHDLNEKYKGRMKNGAALYYDVYGSQCTNRGSISSKFYVPNYSSKSGHDNKPELHYTGRMHGGSYVNREDTNYDYYLNGNKVGETNNSGLTDLSIAELPSENIIFGGENEIIRDYDTNPGNHSVTADSEITIVYPPDAEISYIGEPDTLQDVRLKPDFAVYDENIFCNTKDLVVGDKTKLKFNIYNRGSNNGWCDISVKDGNNIIFTESNYFFEAFSGRTIEFDWTPTSTDNDISISLANTTSNIDERKTDNNTANRTITARKRITPNIVSIAPSVILSSEDIILSADVDDYADVSKVEFYINDKIVTGQTENSGYSGNMRYWINAGKLEANVYSIKAKVYYKTSSISDNSIEQVKDLVVKDKYTETCEFNVKDAVNPRFKLYSINDYRYSNTYTEILSKGDNSYTFEMTQEMINNPKDYILFMYTDDYVVYKTLDEINQGFSKEGLNNVSILKNDKITITGVAISDINDKYISYYDYFSTSDKISLPPAKYTLNVEFESSKIKYTKTFDIDLTEGNGEISLEDYFYIDLDSDIVNPEIKILYKKSDMSTYVYDLDLALDKSSDTQYKILANDTLLNNLSNAYVVVNCDNGILWGKFDENRIVNLTLSDCGKLTISDSDNVRIRELTLTDFGEFKKNISAKNLNNIYITKGEYEITCNYEYKGYNGYDSYKVDLTNGDAQLNLIENIKLFSFNMPDLNEDTYVDAKVYYKNSNGNWNSSRTSEYIDGKTLNMFVTSETAIDKLNNNEDVYLCIKTEDENESLIYVLKTSDYIDGYKLDKSILKKVTFVNDDSSFEVIRTTTSFLEMEDITSYNSEMYLPSGKYNIEVIYKLHGVNIADVFEVDLTDKDAVINVSTSKEKMSDLQVSWDNFYNDIGYVRLSNKQYNFSSYDFKNSDKFTVLKDMYEADIYLEKGNSEYSYTVDNVDLNNDNSIKIGKNISAKLHTYYTDKTYKGNSVLTMRISDCIDEYNNSLIYTYIDGYYSGNVILTNINDEQDVYIIPVRVSDIFYNDINVKLPNVTGEYKVHIDLTEKQYKYDFTPYAIPGATSFVDSISVELLSNDGEAKIYYTIDGSEPTEETGVLYTTPLILTESTNIKALAVNGYGEHSDIVEFSYTKTVIPKVETPIIDNSSKTFSETKTIEIICNTEGAEIYYTLDGSEPSINSIKYVEPFEISETTTIKVLAVKEGFTDSDIAVYTLRKTTGGNGGGGGGGGSGYIGGNGKSSSNAPKNDIIDDIPNVEIEDENKQDGSEKNDVLTTYKFSDVINGSWAEEAIGKMAELGFIKGVGNDKFLPDNNAKRADFVLIITKMLNLSGKSKTNFDDVYPDKYYYDALGLAKENNIIYGIGDNKFNPEMNISRQDAMVMLCRILELKGFEMKNDVNVLSEYTDTDKISSYAKESITKLITSKIIVGNNKKIEPQKNITRAEMSVMLYKAYELLSDNEKNK